MIITKNNDVLTILCVVLFCIHYGFGQLLYAGDPCRTNAGLNGICKISQECLSEIEIQRKTGRKPTLCGFDGGNVAICCPNSAESSTPSRPAAPSRPQTSGNRVTSRKAEQKCKEYSSQVTHNLGVIPLTPDPELITLTVPNCVQNSSPLIVGGEEANIGEFPHMTAVGYNDNGVIKYNCGGTLISERYVLTAAHCTFSRDYGSPVSVRLGDHDLDSNDDGLVPVNVAISNIYVHPEFKSPSRYHDIALLKLENNVRFTNTTRPACLWHRQNIDKNSAVATGWGRLLFDGDRPSVLQKVSLDIIDQARCRALPVLDPAQTSSRVLRRGLIGEQMCAGDLKRGGKDTCQGDSGGPLQITAENNRCIFFLIGVTSFGTGCGGRENPGIYTRVSSYVDWIESVVWP